MDEEQEASVTQAFEDALAQSKRAARAKDDWDKEQVQFMEWLAKRHPDCSQWRMINRRIIREYMATFKDKAANTIRLRMQPIIQTSAYMSREYSLPNVAEKLGIGNKLKKTPPMVYLADVVAFLSWVREKDPLLEVGAVLQGLAGLQLQEALRLTWDKVDLDRGLIEISGEVKNAYRNRVIPVCAGVVETLRRICENRSSNGVVPVVEHVVLSPTGCSFVGGNSFRNYSNRLSKSFRVWNEKVDWSPKDLRNCILTWAVMEDRHSEVWEQYVGHSPRSITARHYIPRLAHATSGEKNALEKQMAAFRFQITEPLNLEIAKAQNEGEVKILNFFEPATPNEPSGTESFQESKTPQVLETIGLEA